MLEEDLSVVVIEKREGIGGVWRYSDDPSILIVMKSTCCTSSSLPGAAMGYQNGGMMQIATYKCFVNKSGGC